MTVRRDNLLINKQQDASSIQNFILSRNSTCFGHNLHETYQLPRVQLITPDDGHRRCPKYVEFRNKITFWILDASWWLFIRRPSLISQYVINPTVRFLIKSVPSVCIDIFVWEHWVVDNYTASSNFTNVTPLLILFPHKLSLPTARKYFVLISLNIIFI